MREMSFFISFFTGGCLLTGGVGGERLGGADEPRSDRVTEGADGFRSSRPTEACGSMISTLSQLSSTMDVLGKLG